MKKTLTTEQRVAKILEGMRKAMPEIKRQVAVYEKSLQHSTGAKSAPLTIHSRNV